MSTQLRMPPRAPAPRNPELNQKQRSPAKAHKFVPPNMGLNLKDALESMKPGDALRLDNLIAQPDGVSTRNGRDIWTPKEMWEPLGGVRSLFDYSAPNVEKLFAADNDQIIDVTNKGAPVAVPAPGNRSYNSGEWSTAQVQSTAGTFLVCVNGADPPIVFNGAAWSAHTMTFAAAPAVINTFCVVFCHMGRLWFAAKDTSDLYYLQVASLGGALTKFSIGSLMRRGGSIATLQALTRDGGLGSDDLFVVVTTKGEVLTYAGNNPASVNTWGLVGVYMLPPPIGRRCVAKMGADLAILTTRGIMPMQEVMRLAAVQQGQASLTERINSMLGYEYERNFDEFGWEITEFPKKNLVVLNVPISATESFPYVMHAETGGWCRWVGYDATCFQSFQGKLFCGDAFGNIWEYTDAYTDIDVPITCEMVTAYDVIGSPGTKTVAALRPTFKGPVTSALPVAVFTDYDTDRTITDIGHINITGPAWNTTAWGPTTVAPVPPNSARPPWGPRNDPVNAWQVSMGNGYAIAIGMRFVTNDSVTITGVDMLYEEAAPL